MRNLPLHRHRSVVGFVIIVACLLTCTPLSIAAAQYTFTYLGPFGGYGHATGINNLGHVVGYSQVGTSNTIDAFYWNGSGPIQDIGFATNALNLSNFAINDHDQVVGTVNNQAAIWQPGQSVQPIFTDPSITYSSPTAINNAGAIVGSLDTSSGGQPSAFYYVPGQPVQILAPTASNYFGPTALNNLGQSVGLNTTRSGDLAGYWSPPSNVQSINALGGPGSASEASYATGINDQGTVVGYYYGSSGTPLAYKWNAPGPDSFVTLPALGLDMNGFISTGAAAINSSGDIVGYSSDGTLGTQAVLWHPDGTIEDLNSETDIPSGWTNLSATGINDAGQIVGFGILNGEAQPFLLTPTPEPMGLLITLPALMLLARRRRINKV